MAQLLTVSYLDVNGESGSNRFYIDAAADAATVCADLKALTNCQITEANILSPVDISTLANNTAPTAANVESALFKASVTLEGPQVGAGGTNTGAPNARVTIQIPAPVGDLVNGMTGNPKDPRLTALLGKIVSNHGDAMTSVRSVKYVR